MSVWVIFINIYLLKIKADPFVQQLGIESCTNNNIKLICYFCSWKKTSLTNKKLKQEWSCFNYLQISSRSGKWFWFCGSLRGSWSHTLRNTALMHSTVWINFWILCNCEYSKGNRNGQQNCFQSLAGLAERPTTSRLGSSLWKLPNVQ